jgi:hypothetical protein
MSIEEQSNVAAGRTVISDSCYRVGRKEGLRRTNVNSTCLDLRLMYHYGRLTKIQVAYNSKDVESHQRHLH